MSEPPAGENCKLFVGGIDWKVDDDGLKKIFEHFGEVTDAKVQLDRETQR